VNPVAPAAQRDLVPDRAGPTREIERQAVEAAALAGRIAELDNEVAECGTRLARLDGEDRTIPVSAEHDVTASAVRLAERARRHLRCAADLTAEQRRHDGDLIARDQAWARYAEYAGSGCRTSTVRPTHCRSTGRRCTGSTVSCAWSRPGRRRWRAPRRSWRAANRPMPERPVTCPHWTVDCARRGSVWPQRKRRSAPTIVTS